MVANYKKNQHFLPQKFQKLKGFFLSPQNRENIFIIMCGPLNLIFSALGKFVIIVVSLPSSFLPSFFPLLFTVQGLRNNTLYQPHLPNPILSLLQATESIDQAISSLETYQCISFYGTFESWCLEGLKNYFVKSH